MDKRNGKRRQMIINGEMARMTIIVFRLLLVLLVLFDILDAILIISGDQEFNAATIAYLIITLLVLCFILFLKKSVGDTEKKRRFSSKRDTTNSSENHSNPRKKAGIDADKDQNLCSYTEIENQYFGKLVFQKDDTSGIMETTIREINFGGTVLNIDICIHENSDMDIMLDKLKSICADASEFMQEVYPQLAEFCNGIDLYDENGRIIDNFNEDLLMEKYRLKWINVDTNSERENIINISGYICDDVDQEIEIQVNCTSNNITCVLL